MNSLGIRVRPNAATIAVFSSDAEQIINVEDIKIPKALSVPEGLKYIRNSILDVLREYHIERAALRISESNAKKINIRRIEIEGVIQEAFASSLLSSYFCGQIATIASKLNINRALFKQYITDEVNFDRVENWTQHNKYEKEAILTALGGIHA